jgi:hypothetical protein
MQLQNFGLASITKRGFINPLQLINSQEIEE